MNDAEALQIVMQQDRKYWGSGWLCWLHCKANYDPSRGNLLHYLHSKLRWHRNPQPTGGTTGLRQCEPIGVVEDNIPSSQDFFRPYDEPLVPLPMSNLNHDEWARCYLLAKGYTRSKICQILTPDLNPLTASSKHHRALLRLGHNPRRRQDKTSSPLPYPPK